ncbi:MAG: hypothetical protein WEB53_16325 [Akkermansiaceae bacterium]
MPLIDHLLAIGPIRKAIWKLWYPFLTKRLQGEDVIFLNYAFETDPPMAIPLSGEDEPNRACIQLYHHVGMQVNLSGKNVLEVSCGHGGGASYLTRTQGLTNHTGLDLNSARSLALLDQKLPKWLQGLGRDFAGVQGSRIYTALETGALSYRSYCFRKA